MSNSGKPRQGRAIAALMLTGGALALGGCSMPNSSNPTLAIESTRVADAAAQFELLVENPSERDLVLVGIDYTVTIGPLPVAEGRWEGREAIAAGETARITLQAPYDTPPLDPDAQEVEIAGEMQFDDQTGSGAMAMQRTAFRRVARIR